MSPYEIGLLLHAHARPEPFEECRILDASVTHLAANGLIEKQDGREYWTCTPRGDAHVRQLMCLPFPTPAWIGADGKVIE